MKKLTIAVVILTLVCALWACTGETDGGTTATTTENTVTTTSAISRGTTATTQPSNQNGSEITAATQEETTTSTVVTSTVKTTAPKTTTSTTKITTTTEPSTHGIVEASVFDDAVIIGDSVTLKLSLYVSNQKNKGNYPLGQAKFLCSGSLGYNNALWAVNAKDNVHPRYNGTKYRIPDGVKATGANKVFIMLGMNDFMLYGMDGTIDAAETLIGEILQKSPDAKIYVQSVTPIIASKESGSKTNANVRTLNTKLRAMCNKYGWMYLDVASVMVDDNGALKSSYCGDPDTMGIHFTDAACKAWIEYLKQNV